MSAFQNVHCFPHPDGALFRPEIDVVLSVVETFLGRMEPNATLGTVILDGQAYGNDAKCILRFDLSDGPFDLQVDEKTVNSHRLAEQAIDEALKDPRDSRYLQQFRPEYANGSRKLDCSYSFYTSIWMTKELMTLVLNATQGRFLASCCIKGNSADLPPEYGKQVSVAVLYGIAYTLRKLRPLDANLRDASPEYLHATLKLFGDVVGAFCVAMEHAVDDLFDRSDAPAIQAWNDWRRFADDGKKRSVFFQ